MRSSVFTYGMIYNLHVFTLHDSLDNLFIVKVMLLALLNLLPILMTSLKGVIP